MRDYPIAILGFINDTNHLITLHTSSKFCFYYFCLVGSRRYHLHWRFRLSHSPISFNCSSVNPARFAILIASLISFSLGDLAFVAENETFVPTTLEPCEIACADGELREPLLRERDFLFLRAERRVSRRFRRR